MLLFMFHLTFFVCIIWNVSLSSTHVVIGGIMVAVGACMLLMGLWALITSALTSRNMVVLRTGVYKLCRHPQYAGMIFICLGLALMRGLGAERTLFWAGLLLLILEKLADREEDLTLALPNGRGPYLAYRYRTPKFIPWGKAEDHADVVLGQNESMCQKILKRCCWWDALFYVAALYCFVKAVMDADMPFVWPCVCWLILLSGICFIVFSIRDLGFDSTVLGLPPPPDNQQRLRHVTYGVYQWCRHPQYLGMILFGLGMTAYWHHLDRATNGLFWTTLLMLTLQKKIDFEETELLASHATDGDFQTYDDEFQDYCVTTPGLIPWIELPFADSRAAELWFQNIVSGVYGDMTNLPDLLGNLMQLPWLCSDCLSSGSAAAPIERPLLPGDHDVWYNGEGQSTFLNCLPLRARSRVPSWAYDEGARSDRADAERDFFHVQRRACGPGVRWAWRAVGNNYILFVIVPFLALSRSSCDAAGGFAICDDLPLFALFFISWLCAMTCQVKCISSVLLAQLGHTREFRLNLGVAEVVFNHFPFRLWLVLFLLLSTFNLLDTFSNAELVGRVLATRSCNSSYTEINTVWSQVMTQSFISKMLWFTKFDLANEFLFLYALILLQLFSALYTCVPIEEGVCYERVQLAEDPDRKTKYKTICFQRHPVDHGAVLQMLAETARLEGVIFQDSRCTKLGVTHLNQPGNVDLTGILVVIQAKIARLTMRFFLVGLLQNGLQVNVQISMMAVSKVTTGKVDGQLLFSVILGFMGLAFDFPDMIEAGRLVYDLMTEVDGVASDRKCRTTFFFYCVCMLMYLGLLLFTIAKFVGFFVCESHLINLNGCAALPTVLSNTTELHVLWAPSSYDDV